MSIISMSSPSITLDRILDTIHNYLDYDVSYLEFTTVNLGLCYIYVSEDSRGKLIINCHNYYELGKQFVSVVSFSGGNRPYIWFSDFLEDLDE